MISVPLRLSVSTVPAVISVSSPRTRALRLELMALAAATAVLVCGVALAQAAVVERSTVAGAIRTPEEFRRAVASAVALILAGFYGLHALRRFRRDAGDGILLGAVLALCGLGLMTMIAVRDPLHDSLLAVPFAWGVLLGCGAAAVALTVDYERLRSFTYLPLAAALVVSAVLVLFGTGPGQSGVKVALWGGQPVDAIRFLEVLFLAGYFGRRWEYLRSLQDPYLGQTRVMAAWHVPPLDYLLPLLLCLAATLSFYVLQKDLGPALIMACLFMALYASATGRVGLAAGGIATLMIAFWIGYEAGIPSTVRTRVAMWLSPWENGLRGGDQVAHGLWALATGGWAGTGAGMGDAGLVPAAHTDFVLAVIGEELGFAGVLAALVLYAVIVWRAMRIAVRASGDYSRFLALGLALGLVLQLLLIAGGILALVPLSGVVTPFLSYGKSAMIVNLASVGILLSIASRAPTPPTPAFETSVRRLSFVLAAAGIAIVARAAQIQLVAADEMMARPALTLLADGSYRFQDNPRLIAAAREVLPRGRILDRAGVVLASGGTASDRDYPLGGRTYHLLGDVRSERDWAASNTSFVERDAAARLRGFDDHAARVTRPRPAGSGTVTLLRRDYSQLIPVVRYRYRPSQRDVQQIAHRPRDLTMTIDARLQAGVADLLSARLQAGGFERGAAIVVDVATREVLASVSYPWPADAEPGERIAPEARLDRVRYGLYPPGSAFKLVTAIAAMKRGPEAAARRYLCERLPDGRVGRRIEGWRRPVRDDPKDHVPHGLLSLEQGLVVSCNAYFAQLAVEVGSQALRETARDFDIALTTSDAPPRLRATLPFAGFGQGEVVATPARLAQVVVTIADGGVLAPFVWVRNPPPASAPPRRVLSRAAAADLAFAMREAVTSGTARVLAGNRTAIAGKTGTAELEEQPSHAWFAGFAPYQTRDLSRAASRHLSRAESRERQIAFVVLVENGGYGARAAAPIAGAVVDLARELRIIQ